MSFSHPIYVKDAFDWKIYWNYIPIGWVTRNIEQKKRNSSIE